MARLLLGTLLIVIFVTLNWCSHDVDAWSSSPTFYYGESRYNKSCANFDGFCRPSLYETCDYETHLCKCQSPAIYDSSQRRCRQPYCFEHCTETGYECRNGWCQLCWAPDGQNLCDRPEDIYIPVAIAVGITFVITVTLTILIKLCCCLRRCCRNSSSDAKEKRHRHQYQPIMQQQQQQQNNELPFPAANSNAGLLQSQCPTGQSEPPVVPPRMKVTPVHASNPFAVAMLQSDAAAATISTQVNVQHSLGASETTDDTSLAASVLASERVVDEKKSTTSVEIC